MSATPTPVTDAVMRRLSKILALAQRGDRGEQAAAQAQLESILKRHGLTLDDIENKPKREWVEVRFVGDQEQLLMDQIIRKVTQQRTFSIKRIPRTRSRYYVELSPAEHVEVEFMFELMKVALEKEVKKVTMAFLMTNKLFGPRAEDADDQPDDRTPEQRAEHRQIAMMAMGMAPVNVHKAIEK